MGRKRKSVGGTGADEDLPDAPAKVEPAKIGLSEYYELAEETWSRHSDAEKPASEENVKKALVEGTENSTTLAMRSMKNTERVYKNKAAEQVIEIEKEFPG